MNPTKKKARLITRSRYSAPIYGGKENATVRTVRIKKLGGKAALLCQPSHGWIGFSEDDGKAIGERAR
jgi:hypothetical protein